MRADDGVITAIGEKQRGADLVVDAEGGALLPGLHDHHVHLMAMAAARTSLDLATRGLDALRHAPGDGWVRAVGYHEAVHGPLDRDRLDALVPDRPVRVQHRTGQLWVLIGAALRGTAIDRRHEDGIERDERGRVTGRLFRRDDLVRALTGGDPPDVAAAAVELARYGITGVSDLTPIGDPADLHALAAVASRPGFPVTVAVTGGVTVADVDAGLPRGPVKIVLDETRLPPFDALVAMFAKARAARRAIAVHCVTRTELVVALAAWDEVGSRPGDRIEHAAVLPVELVDAVHERGLVVVTQPSFVAARGDQYLADVAADDVAHLWRCGSLLDAGIGVAGSSDAPYGDPNPWAAIAAARDRATPAGVVLGPGERIPAGRALELYLGPLAEPAGPPRRVAVGAPADLCLLAEPLGVALADPTAVSPRATFRAGALVAGGH